MTDVVGELRRCPPVHQQAVIAFKLTNGATGLRTHDAVYRSGVIAQPRKTLLDFNNHWRGCRWIGGRSPFPCRFSEVDLIAVGNHTRYGATGRAQGRCG